MPAVYLFRGLHFLFPYLVTSYPSNSLSIFSHVDDCTDTSASVSTRTFMEMQRGGSFFDRWYINIIRSTQSYQRKELWE